MSFFLSTYYTYKGKKGYVFEKKMLWRKIRIFLLILSKKAFPFHHYYSPESLAENSAAHF